MINRTMPKARIKKSKRPERVLLLCYFDPNGILTVPENIAYLQKFSNLSIDIYNLYNLDRSQKFKINNVLKNYNAVIFHNTVTYDVASIISLEKNFKKFLSEFDGLKVLFKQDEQYRAHSVAKFIGDIKADLVFSCLPESEYFKVYPKKHTGNIQFAKMLTGYVTPEMRDYNFSQLDNRPIDVGYRGSLQPITFGKLAYEKQQIGYDFLKAAYNSGLVLDISSNWQDRIPGNKWIKFLSSCKSTLGTESGASIFDLEGDVEKTYRRIVQEIGENPESAQWSIKILDRLKDYEGNINYNQISPRHFEAAATRTLQLLYEGEYSGIFKPYNHYIPVKKDFSNFEELETTIKDGKIRREITDRAFEEIILNRKNWIETFAAFLDRQIIGGLEEKNGGNQTWLSSISAQTNVLLICGHQPYLDPRIKWIVENAQEGIQIHVLGLHDDSIKKEDVTSINKNGSLNIEVYRKESKENWIASLTPPAEQINPGVTTISFFNQLAAAPKNVLKYYLGIDADNPRFNSFIWYINHFAYSATALSVHGIRFKNIDAVIATDLDTLAAGIVLKEHFNSSLIYDAHEYWAESDTNSSDWERNFWKSIENSLLPSVDLALTVSPNMAQFMSSQYKHPFISVPNAEPLSVIEKSIKQKPLVSKTGEVAFIYQGNYAAGRGLELLLDAWPQTDECAHLFLRGKHNSYENLLKKIAESSGLLNKRIFFLDPVSENHLTESAKSADVGVIPYAPVCVNHKYCCPNKLSQYCHAALPILANHTDFVADMVIQNRLGRVVDFANRDELVRAVNLFVTEKPERDDWAIHAHEFFKTYFHWEQVSQPLYEYIFQINSKRRILDGVPNQTFFTPELLIQKQDTKRQFKTTIFQMYSIIITNQKITNTYIYKVARFFWRLIPISLRSRFLS